MKSCKQLFFGLLSVMCTGLIAYGLVTADWANASVWSNVKPILGAVLTAPLFLYRFVKEMRSKRSHTVKAG